MIPGVAVPGVSGKAMLRVKYVSLAACVREASAERVDEARRNLRGEPESPRGRPARYASSVGLD